MACLVHGNYQRLNSPSVLFELPPYNASNVLWLIAPAHDQRIDGTLTCLNQKLTSPSPLRRFAVQRKSVSTRRLWLTGF